MFEIVIDAKVEIRHEFLYYQDIAFYLRAAASSRGFLYSYQSRIEVVWKKKQRPSLATGFSSFIRSPPNNEHQIY